MSITRPLLALVIVVAPSLAMAHVSVRPRESHPNAEERYTVTVPTEGTVATTHVQLEIPTGVTVLELVPHEGASFETAKQGDRITAITWRKDIPPKAVAEFVFRARNPTAGDLVWKAHQHFSDGTVADWIGIAGDKRPASFTTLSAASPAAAQSGGTDATEIDALLKGHDAAFNAKELDNLATFHRRDITVYVGRRHQQRRVVYRDRHHGPELNTFENLQFGHNRTSHRASRWSSAYAGSDDSIKAKMAGRERDSRGLETLVLLKEANGTFAIPILRTVPARPDA